MTEKTSLEEMEEAIIVPRDKNLVKEEPIKPTDLGEDSDFLTESLGGSESVSPDVASNKDNNKGRLQGHNEHIAKAVEEVGDKLHQRKSILFAGMSPIISFRPLNKIGSD